MAETNRKNDGAPQVPAQALGTQALAAGFCAFQNLVQGNLDLIYRADAADRLEWIAPAGLHLLGYETAEPLLGRDAAVLYCHPQERAALREAVARGTGPVCQEEILRCADGGSLVVRSRAVRRTDATGAPAGMEVHSLVLSGELEARLNLARALREMETIFNNALVGMALVRKAHIEKINVRGLELLGYPASRLVGTDLDFLFPTPEAHHCFLEALRQDLSATGVHIGEYSLVRGDGASLIMRTSVKRISPCDATQGTILSFDDVTEQRRLMGDLRASKQAAEAANVAKTQFLANMSHELRTPLNGIMGMTQLLLDGPEASGETREYLGIIRQSAAMLMHVVGDLLDLSNVESGQLSVVEREFDVKAELLPLLRNFTSQSLSRAFEFSYVFDPQLPTRLIGDPDRTKQILLNLIGNAFKYTRKGSVTVHLGVQEASSTPPQAVQAVRPGHVRLFATVTDTGFGIDPRRQTTIFEPFGIGEDYLTKKYSGAGLGLTIAKRLARMMGGDITVTSDPGRGSTFALTLECGLPQGERVRPEASKKTPSVVAPGGGLCVLLAEDEPVNRIFTVRALEKLGHTVDTAADGREALSMVGRKAYDLVLMDIQMPRLNGLEATRLIRSGQVPGVSPKIPVVALTAYAMDSDRQQGLEAGMDEYVTKPFEPAELVQAMNRALGA